MAVTRASASRISLPAPKTTKNVTKRTKMEGKRQGNISVLEEKQGNKKKRPKNCSSTLKKHTKSSPGIRLIGGRIYDSENGKTCHQCRQKTADFSASCKNVTSAKKCTFHYCHICLLNRYGERAEEAVEMGCQWKCPSCRGVCNCSKCMKKRGCGPTGVLVRTAKANGFSSVSEMLQLEKIEKPEPFEGTPSKKKKKASNQEPVGSLKEVNNESNPSETTNSTCQAKAFNNVDGNEKNLRGKGIHDATTMIDDTMGKEKASEIPIRMEMLSSIHGINLVDNISRELSNEQDNEFADPVMFTNYDLRLVENVSSELSNEQDNELEDQIRVSHFDISLPQGTELNRVADLDLPAEDVGHALQFLEFCEAFGKVLHLKKGQPELLLRQLTVAKDSRRKHDFSVERLHIRLLSMIQHDQEKGTSSLKARGRNSWLEALGNYIAKCRHLSKELILDCSNLGPDKYEKLNTSKKLRILTFLCDEALGTPELRNWIDDKNSEFLEERKRAKGMFLVKEKNEREKLKAEVAKAILLKHGAPVSIKDHENLVSVIKMEVAQSLSEKLEAANNKITRKHCHAVRSYPVLLDAVGRKFWKLRSYGEVDVLLQEVTYGDLSTAQEKWFVYDLSQKANVERYISSFKET